MLTYLTCLSQLALVVKAKSQMRHWKGRSPLCVLRCRIKVDLSALEYEHRLHL